jgi:hypothetical protein
MIRMKKKELKSNHRTKRMKEGEVGIGGKRKLLRGDKIWLKNSLCILFGQ